MLNAISLGPTATKSNFKTFSPNMVQCINYFLWWQPSWIFNWYMNQKQKRFGGQLIQGITFIFS